MSGTRQLPERIATERLILRRYSLDDAAWYYAMALRNHSHLARYEAESFVMGIDAPEVADLVIQDLVENWDDASAFFFGAFLKADRTAGSGIGDEGLPASSSFVAQIYIGPVNWELPEIEVGYFADVEHEGHGYVTEALRACIDWIFTHLNAHRIRVECDDTNQRSAAVAERCGFTREAHLRENQRNADGTLTGTFVYGLLRREYEEGVETAPGALPR